MSVQLRLVAKAPGSLRPSLLALAIGLAALAALLAGLDAAAVVDDVAADGEAGVDDPITAGAGLLTVFEVHALRSASATHAALAAVATARRW
ncbi:MAG TPA: hypothetical protein VIJ96_18820 [Acidothermaceae bacterium]